MYRADIVASCLELLTYKGRKITSLLCKKNWKKKDSSKIILQKKKTALNSLFNVLYRTEFVAKRAGFAACPNIIKMQSINSAVT